jgi:hypothetical protein
MQLPEDVNTDGAWDGWDAWDGNPASSRRRAVPVWASP